MTTAVIKIGTCTGMSALDFGTDEMPVLKRKLASRNGEGRGRNGRGMLGGGRGAVVARGVREDTGLVMLMGDH